MTRKGLLNENLVSPIDPITEKGCRQNRPGEINDTFHRGKIDSRKLEAGPDGFEGDASPTQNRNGNRPDKGQKEDGLRGVTAPDDPIEQSGCDRDQGRTQRQGKHAPCDLEQGLHFYAEKQTQKEG